MAEQQVLVRVKDLKKHFPITRGIIVQRQVGAIKAVDGGRERVWQIDYRANGAAIVPPDVWRGTL